MNKKSRLIPANENMATSVRERVRFYARVLHLPDPMVSHRRIGCRQRTDTVLDCVEDRNCDR